MPLEEFLERHQIFTWEEFNAFIQREGKRSPKAVDTVLWRLRRQDLVGRIRRGLYFAVPPNQPADSCKVDPYLAASRITGDAVLGYSSALEIHTRAKSPSFGRVCFLTGQKTRATTFRDIRFVPFAHPQALRRSGWTQAEVETVERAGQQVQITSQERTLVDTLNRLQRCGGWQVLWPRLKKLTRLNLDRIVEYLDLLDNPTAAARVGWYADRYSRCFNGSPDDYALFERGLPDQPRYLVPGERGGVLQPDWNLIVPAELAE